MTTSEPYFDGREMYMFHDMFRREFSLMPGLVRGVTAGDQKRTQIISGHIANVNSVLHAHHGSEDKHVWPLLHDRGPEDVAAIVQLMESQHAELEKTASEADEAVAAWRSSATAGTRDALASTLDNLIPLLKAHMAAEEEHVVPLMEQHITAAEWIRMAGEGAADVDPETLILGFGMVMYEGDPEIIDITVKNLPEEVRPVIRQLASQAFAAHAELVHGTATPPRSTEL